MTISYLILGSSLWPTFKRAQRPMFKRTPAHIEGVISQTSNIRMAVYIYIHNIYIYIFNG